MNKELSKLQTADGCFIVDGDRVNHLNKHTKYFWIIATYGEDVTIHYCSLGELIGNIDFDNGIKLYIDSRSKFRNVQLLLPNVNTNVAIISQEDYDKTIIKLTEVLKKVNVNDIMYTCLNHDIIVSKIRKKLKQLGLICGKPVIEDVDIWGLKGSYCYKDEALYSIPYTDLIALDNKPNSHVFMNCPLDQALPHVTHVVLGGNKKECNWAVVRQENYKPAIFISSHNLDANDIDQITDAKNYKMWIFDEERIHNDNTYWKGIVTRDGKSISEIKYFSCLHETDCVIDIKELDKICYAIKISDSSINEYFTEDLAIDRFVYEDLLILTFLNDGSLVLYLNSDKIMKDFLVEQLKMKLSTIVVSDVVKVGISNSMVIRSLHKKLMDLDVGIRIINHIIGTMFDIDANNIRYFGSWSSHTVFTFPVKPNETVAYYDEKLLNDSPDTNLYVANDPSKCTWVVHINCGIPRLYLSSHAILDEELDKIASVIKKLADTNEFIF